MRLDQYAVLTPLSLMINLRRVQVQLCINWLTPREKELTPLPKQKKKALKRPSEGDPSPSKKRRVTPELTRKRKAGTGALTPPAKKTKVSPQSSSASESENESFDPREDKDNFQNEGPKNNRKVY